MARQERRRTERYPTVFPVSVVADESLPLEGETVDYSPTGLLLTARGSLTVRVGIRGSEYRGRLVRAVPTADGRTAYAVELEEPVRTVDMPGTTLVPVDV